MYKVEFKVLTGVLKKISGILGLSLWELLMPLPHCEHLVESIWLDFGFCAKTSGLITRFVYPITERDNKSRQISGTLLNNLVDFNSTVVRLVSLIPQISRFRNLFSRLLGIIRRAPITFGITVTFISSDFFSSLAKSSYLATFSFSFIFTLWSNGMAKATKFFSFG